MRQEPTKERAGALVLFCAALDLNAAPLRAYLRALHKLFYPELADIRREARGDRIIVVHGAYSLPEPL